MSKKFIAVEPAAKLISGDAMPDVLCEADTLDELKNEISKQDMYEGDVLAIYELRDIVNVSITRSVELTSKGLNT